MELIRQTTETNNNSESASSRSKKDDEPKLSKRTKARLGSSALDLNNFLKGTPDYYDDEESHQEYLAEKQKRETVQMARPNYPEYYHDWQIECLERIKNERNVILSSPTGSGKTTVFLDWAQDKKAKAEKEAKGKHTIYITSPIKALSNQRFRELQKAGYSVGLETGDVKIVPKDADYICCTQEIYTNKYTNDENATLIIDEFHYISENQERSRAYIDGLHDSKAQNVLLCSATFGDVESLNGYIEKVTNRSFLDYENHERLTDLEISGYISPKEIQDALIVSFSARNCKTIAGKLADIRESADDDTIEQIKKICEKYKVGYDDRWGKGVGTYYGKMLPKEKACTEELFEKGLIDTIAGTDALALGVNFPVDKVVFAQLAKYGEGPISKNLFDQLAGRAGRKGYHDKGTVYYCDNFRNDRGYPLEPRGYNHLISHSNYDDDDEYGRRMIYPEDYEPDTAELFDELVYRSNETIQIDLSPRIKRILQGQTTIEEEAEYICKYSTTGKSFDEIEMHEIGRLIAIINDYAFDNPYLFLSPEESERLMEAGERLNQARNKWEFEDGRVRTEATAHLPKYENGVEYNYIDIREKETEGISGRFVFGLTNDGRIVFEESRSFNQGLSDEEKTRLIGLMQYAYDNKKQLHDKLEQEYYVLKLELLSKWKELFLQEIKLIYNDELSVEENCLLCLGLITGRGEDIFGRIEPEDDYYYDWDDGEDEGEIDRTSQPLINLDKDNYEALCKIRRIVMGLPKKYRTRFDIVALERKIADIDDTILEDGGTNGLFAASDIQELLKEKSE